MPNLVLVALTLIALGSPTLFGETAEHAAGTAKEAFQDHVVAPIHRFVTDYREVHQFDRALIIEDRGLSALVTKRARTMLGTMLTGDAGKIRTLMAISAEKAGDKITSPEFLSHLRALMLDDGKPRYLKFVGKRHGELWVEVYDTAQGARRKLATIKMQGRYSELLGVRLGPARLLDVEVDR